MIRINKCVNLYVSILTERNFKAWLLFRLVLRIDGYSEEAVSVSNHDRAFARESRCGLRSCGVTTA